MAYATAQEVALRLGRDLEPTAEAARVDALLIDVSALVDGFCRRSFSPTPADVKAVVIAEVIRLLNTNPGISVEDVGDVRVEYAATSGGLSRSARDSLQTYRLKYGSVRLSGSTWTATP